MPFNQQGYQDRIETERNDIWELISFAFRSETIQYQPSSRHREAFIQDNASQPAMDRMIEILGMYTYLMIFKCVDLLFEQLLIDNGESPRGSYWSFTEKRGRWRRIHRRTGLVLPNLFQNSPTLLTEWFDYYDNNLNMRNDIAHNQYRILYRRPWYFKLEDSHGSSHDIDISPNFIRTQYFIITSLIHNAPSYKIINQDCIVQALDNMPNKKGSSQDLLNAFGNWYTREFNYYLDILDYKPVPLLSRSHVIF